jgi:hypothetical protein
MRRQLSYLMSQVPTLLMENKELKDFAARATSQIDDLSTALDQHRRQAQQQQQQAQISTPTGSSDTGNAAAVNALSELRADIASLRDQMVAMEATTARDSAVALSSSRDVVEAAAPSAGTEVEFSSTLTAVQWGLATVQEQVAALQGSIEERTAEAAASRGQVEALSVVVQALSAAKDMPEPQSPPPPIAEDVVAKVSRIKGGSPEAAVLASQVSAAAKADLEEQFGQLRHRIEVATALAEAAEEAARRSAESAAAAEAALESASQASATRAASLQETVIAMIAGVEQEQAALKHQVRISLGHVLSPCTFTNLGLPWYPDDLHVRGQLYHVLWGIRRVRKRSTDS